MGEALALSAAALDNLRSNLRATRLALKRSLCENATAREQLEDSAWKLERALELTERALADVEKLDSLPVDELRAERRRSA